MTTTSWLEQLRLRALTSRVGGDALGTLLGLRRSTTSYTVNRIQVPMRDDVQLVADHYAPSTSKPMGTLLVRGPYGRGLPFSIVFARLYAARGYHVVLQSVRGTFGSAGEFEPMANEAADGADTVQWLRQQPWFTGRFGTLGLSYLGFTQWALLQDPPPELAAAVITVGPHDFRDAVWGTGSFAINDFLTWSDLIARQEEPGRIQAGIRELCAPRKVARAAGKVPMGPAARALLGEGAPWFESWVEHTDYDDPFWDRLRFPAALDRVRVPVLLLSGWQDIFLSQTLRQYEHLCNRGVDVALTIGPWTHSQMITKALTISSRESLDWVDAYVGGATAPHRPSPVHVYVTGQGWHHLQDWPPGTTERAMYLQPEGTLAETPPSGPKRSVTFRFEPAHPTPTTGGPLLSSAGGYRNDSRLASRADVLAFTSAALTQNLCVYGNPVIELTHTSDNPNVDVFVRVSEVDTNGRSRNVSDGYLRLGDAPETIRIKLDAIAHRFRTGSRIRVLVAGSWFPRYARNLGTTEPALTGRQITPATHTVHFGDSRLLLPVGSTDLSTNSLADAGRDVG